MILKLFSVYDSKAEAFLPPFFQQSTNSSIRAFTDLVNSKDHAFGLHPEDYTLFELGSWNDSTCTYDLDPAHKSLGVGVEFLASNS